MFCAVQFDSEGLEHPTFQTAPRTEVARVLRDVADRIERGEDTGCWQSILAEDGSAVIARYKLAASAEYPLGIARPCGCVPDHNGWQYCPEHQSKARANARLRAAR